MIIGVILYKTKNVDPMIKKGRQIYRWIHRLHSTRESDA